MEYIFGYFKSQIELVGFIVGKYAPLHGLRSGACFCRELSECEFTQIASKVYKVVQTIIS